MKTFEKMTFYPGPFQEKLVRRWTQWRIRSGDLYLAGSLADPLLKDKPNLAAGIVGRETLVSSDTFLAICIESVVFILSYNDDLQCLNNEHAPYSNWFIRVLRNRRQRQFFWLWNTYLENSEYFEEGVLQ